MRPELFQLMEHFDPQERKDFYDQVCGGGGGGDGDDVVDDVRQS